MFNLITVGDPVIDTHVQINDSCPECGVQVDKKQLLCFEYGGKIPITNSFQSLGGNAANMAVGCVNLGLNCSIITTLGQDGYGQQAIDELNKQKVNTEYITVDKNSSTRYSLVLNYKSERTILSYSTKKNYFWPKPCPQTEWFYYTGISEGFEVIQDKMLDHLIKHPTIKLAINPGSYLLKYALNKLKDAVEHADLLIVNLQEAEKILGTTLVKQKTEAALIHGLCKLGAKEVALTDAERGAWAGTVDEVWHLESFPVKVVAKAGAGDAFSSGYLAARHYSHDLTHALSWGIANSCHVIQHPGAQTGLLDQAGMQKMLKQFSKIKPTLAS